MKNLRGWSALAFGLFVANAVLVPLAFERSIIDGLGKGVIAVTLVLIFGWVMHRRDQKRSRQ